MGCKRRFSKEWPRLSDWTKEDTAGELVRTKCDDFDGGVDDADGGKESSFSVESRSGTDRVVDSAMDRAEGGGTRVDICVMGTRIVGVGRADWRAVDRTAGCCWDGVGGGCCCGLRRWVEDNAEVFCLVALLMEWTSRDTCKSFISSDGSSDGGGWVSFSRGTTTMSDSTGLQIAF